MMSKKKWSTKKKAIRNLIMLAELTGDKERVARLKEMFNACHNN